MCAHVLRNGKQSVILTDVAPILAPQLRVNGAPAIPSPEALPPRTRRKAGFVCSVTMTDTCGTQNTSVGWACGLTVAGAMAKGGFRSKASPSPDQSNPFLWSLRVDASAVGGGGLWFRRETEKASLSCYGNSGSHFYGGYRMAQCQSLTKKKTQCPIEDAWVDPATGLFACHVHNTTGTFRKQMEAGRPDRLAKRLARKAHRKGHRQRRPWPPAETSSIKDRH